MKVFVVRKRGVGPREVFGVYSTKGKAKNAAVRARALEPDEWHDMEIVECEMNKDGWTVKQDRLSKDKVILTLSASTGEFNVET